MRGFFVLLGVISFSFTAFEYGGELINSGLIVSII
jgi:hypothetical protein